MKLAISSFLFRIIEKIKLGYNLNYRDLDWLYFWGMILKGGCVEFSGFLLECVAIVFRRVCKLGCRGLVLSEWIYSLLVIFAYFLEEKGKVRRREVIEF